MWSKVLAAVLAVFMLFGGTTALAKSDGKDKPNANHSNGMSWSSGKAKNNSGKSSGGGMQIVVNGKTIVLTFKDVEEEAAWALQYIAKLVKQGVFTGYEDGTFRPNQKVTRIEAITAAVRQMGLRAKAESAEAMASHLNFKDADKIKKKYPWAVGYVAVAVENDLFLENESSVEPDKPADRLWATILLVKALGLEKEAKAKMNSALPFKDKKDIPAGSVGYVAVAVEKGLVTGYENNTFRPDRPVTRAELAAILDRTGEQLPGGNNGDGQFSGVISGAAGSGKISITVNGTTKQYDLSGDVTVLRGNGWASVSDLAAGDKVKFIVAGGKVVFIQVTEKASIADGLYSGTVTAVGSAKLTLAKDGKQTEYEVAANATVFRNNAAAALKDIVVGDVVSVVVSGGKIVHVNVTAPAAQSGEVAGVVAAVYESSVSVAANGAVVKYTLDASASIVRNGEVVELAAVQPGDEVKLVLVGGKVVLLAVTKQVTDKNTVVYEVVGKYEGHIAKDGKVTEISVSTAQNGSVVTRVYSVAADAVVSGNALALEKGVTEIKLIVANRVVTAITIM
mgnify:CR=1 FL=1